MVKYVFAAILCGSVMARAQNNSLPQVPLGGPVGVTANAPTLGYEDVTLADANPAYTLTAYDKAHRYLNLHGTLTAPRPLIAPAIPGLEFTIKNSTAYVISVGLSGGSNLPQVAPGVTQTVSFDGTNYGYSNTPQAMGLASFQGRTTPAATLTQADVNGVGNITNNTSGTAANATAINGVAVTGTPTTGQVPTATGSTTAIWQTPSGGGTSYPPSGSNTVQASAPDGSGFISAAVNSTLAGTPLMEVQTVTKGNLAVWLSNLHNCKNQVVNVDYFGDSYMVHDHATSGTQGPVVSTNRFPEQMRIALQAFCGSAGTGFVLANLGYSPSGGPQFNPEEYSATGSFDFNTSSLGLGFSQSAFLPMNSLVHLSNGAAVTFKNSRNIPFDTLKIACATNSTSGSISVSIDGTSNTVCGTTTSVPNPLWASVSAGSLGLHTVVLTSVGDSYFYGLKGRAGTTGFELSNWAVAGGTSEQMASSAKMSWVTNDPDGVHGVVAGMLTNDINGGYSASTTTSNLIGFINVIQGITGAPSMLFWIEPVSSSYSSGAQTSYVNAEKSICATVFGTYGIQCVNTQDRWGTTYSNTNGYWDTQQHFTDKGALDVASQIAGAFIDTLPATGGSAGCTTNCTFLGTTTFGSGGSGGTHTTIDNLGGGNFIALGVQGNPVCTVASGCGSSAGVSSLNSLTGAVNLTASTTNVSITPSSGGTTTTIGNPATPVTAPTSSGTNLGTSVLLRVALVNGVPLSTITVPFSSSAPPTAGTSLPLAVECGAGSSPTSLTAATTFTVTLSSSLSQTFTAGTGYSAYTVPSTGTCYLAFQNISGATPGFQSGGGGNLLYFVGGLSGTNNWATGATDNTAISATQTTAGGSSIGIGVSGSTIADKGFVTVNAGTLSNQVNLTTAYASTPVCTASPVNASTGQVAALGYWSVSLGQNEDSSWFLAVLMGTANTGNLTYSFLCTKP